MSGTEHIAAVAMMARRLIEAGVSVIPVRADGSKAPAVSRWKPYQTSLATPEELAAWFQKERGLAVKGKVGMH